MAKKGLIIGGLTLAASIVTSLLLASEGHEVEATSSTQPGSLSGIVTNAASGQPLQGVVITLGTHVTTTDNNGYYSFTTLSPGTYSLDYSLSGYSGGANMSITINAGSTTKNVQLIPAPAPTGTLTGKVTDSSTGAAIVGATVTLGGNSVTTDSNGNYTFTNIPPGNYAFSVSASGYQTYTL